MDFVSDITASGRRFRIFALVDDFTRKCLALEVDTSLPGARIARLLERMDVLPKTLVSDNGPEFTGQAMDQWAFGRKVGASISFDREGRLRTHSSKASTESFGTNA